MVLSGVAIVFTWAVNSRTETLNTEMARTLQSITSDVEIVRADVRGLIKDAWERLLPGASGLARPVEPEGEAGQIAEPSEENDEAAESAPRNFSRMVALVDGLSTEAQALARVLVRGMHLTPKQLKGLREGDLAAAANELLQAGLLIRLSGAEGGTEDEDSRVYWFPSGLSGMVKDALTLVAPAPQSVRTAVRNALRRVGYGTNEQFQ